MIFGQLFGRWKGALMAVLAIAVYAVLVGGQPSVVRAAWMGGFALLARQFGRRQDSLNGLPLSATLMALPNPQMVLLSVAPADRDSLPSPETLEALHGYTLLRTDQHGWIHLSTDGAQMWADVER